MFMENQPLEGIWENLLKIEKSTKKSLEQYPSPVFTCSKLTIETLEQGVKYIKS